MADFQAGIGRTDPMCSLPTITEPILSPAAESPSLDPIRTMLEHLVASVARVEARMDDYDRRSSSSRQSHRPEPDPPYSRPVPRSVEVNMPFLPPYSAVTVLTPPLPSSGAFLGFGDGLRQNPNGPASGRRQGPAQRLALQEQQSSWDLPPSSRPKRHGIRGEPIRRQQWRGSSFFVGPHLVNVNMLLYRSGTNILGCLRNHKDSTVRTWLAGFRVFSFILIILCFRKSSGFTMLSCCLIRREGSPTARWTEFLEDVRRRFDPKCFVDYFGVIAKLRQTGSVAEYNAEFEGMLNRVRGVPEGRLVTLYVEGLQHPVRNQVKFQYPPTVAAAIALAVEFDAAIE